MPRRTSTSSARPVIGARPNSNGYMSRQPAPRVSAAQREANMANEIEELAPLLEDMTPSEAWQALKNTVDKVAAKDGEWSGLPIPIDGIRLTLAPRHPWKDRLEGKYFGDLIEGEEKESEGPEIKVRNFWFDERNQQEVYLYEEEGKRSEERR